MGPTLRTIEQLNLSLIVNKIGIFALQPAQMNPKFTPQTILLKHNTLSFPYVPSTELKLPYHSLHSNRPVQGRCSSAAAQSRDDHAVERQPVAPRDQQEQHVGGVQSAE